MCAQIAEANDEAQTAHVVATTVSRRGHDHACSRRGPDAGREWATVERVQSGAAPPPAAEHERQRERTETDWAVDDR